MAQPANSPRIDELRSRLRAEPNSRLFYPLAEELRKAGQHPEAEQVLRAGLTQHQTYLAAWVSLGRVLREEKRDAEAIEPLMKAMQLDPENLVAARLLGDCYLEMGEKVEAIKKYKLVQALMPGDEELDATVDRLALELNPPAVSAPEPPPEAPVGQPDDVFAAGPVGEVSADTAAEGSWLTEDVEAPTPSEPVAEEFPFEAPLPLESAADAIEQGHDSEVATADVEPMLAAHDTSPFEEPVDTYSAAALELEAPEGFHVGRAPLAAEVAAVVPEEALPAVESAPGLEVGAESEAPFEAQDVPSGQEEFRSADGVQQDEADVFAPADEPFDAEPEEPEEEDGGSGVVPGELTNTITMADLYVRQGLVDDARQIYESILARDPGNESVRARLDSLMPAAAMPPAEAPSVTSVPRGSRIERLEKWLAKVSRKEVGRV